MKMTAKTETLLYRLLWLAEKPLRPTLRNLEDGFEAWAFRAGLLRHIRRLEAQGYVETSRDPSGGCRLHRLTEAGRLAALGGRDPEAAWSGKWDRKWRLFLFDIPETERSKRRRLTRTLAAAGCGCLQGSVWIAPRVGAALESLAAGDDSECSQLMMLLADSKGKGVDARMVTAAWDFDAINERYRNALEVLGRFASHAVPENRAAIEQWMNEDQVAWKAAFALDPLLPRELLPEGYLGRQAWELRKTILARATKLLQENA
jgi:phenylacetic acid degradation operon negative regulatory protein